MNNLQLDENQTTQQIRQKLKVYLRDLSNGINRGHKVAGVNFQIVSESDLDKFVRVGCSRDATLLRIMGYGDTNVKEQLDAVAIGGVMRFKPDYVLHSNDTNLAALDLKKPEENLDNKRYAEQIVTYCQRINAPLGLLFNGNSVRVFINTQDKQLNKYDSLFRFDYVAAEDMSNPSRVTDLFSKFAAHTFLSEPSAAISLAKSLAKRREKIILGAQRQEQILEILKSRLQTSVADDVEELLAAFAGLNKIWKTVEPKPTEAELMQIWTTYLRNCGFEIPQTSTARKTTNRRRQ